MTILNMGSYISPTPVYAIVIDESVSDSTKAVTYPPMAFGFPVANAGYTPASSVTSFGSWEDCELISGIRRVKGTTGLSKDFTEHTFTESLTFGAGDFVATRFPTYWMKSEKVGTKITIALSKSRPDSTWVDYAGTYKGERRGYFDLAEYLSTTVSSSSAADIAVSGDGKYVSSITPTARYHPAKPFTQSYIHNWQFTQRQYVNVLCVMMFKTLSMGKICGHGSIGTKWNAPVSVQVPASWSSKYGFRWGTGGTLSAVFGLSGWNDTLKTSTSSASSTRGGIALGGLLLPSFGKWSVTPYEGGTPENVTVSWGSNSNGNEHKILAMYGTGGYPFLPVKGETYSGTSAPNGWASVTSLYDAAGPSGDILVSASGWSLPQGLAIGVLNSCAYLRLAFY